VKAREEISSPLFLSLSLSLSLDSKDWFWTAKKSKKAKTKTKQKRKSPLVGSLCSAVSQRTTLHTYQRVVLLLVHIFVSLTMMTTTTTTASLSFTRALAAQNNSNAISMRASSSSSSSSGQRAHAGARAFRCSKMTTNKATSSSSSTTSKTSTPNRAEKKRGKNVSFRLRATEDGDDEGEQVKSDGKFKRAPGEDEEKFQKSVADSPFSRKRIQPLPSKFGVSDRAAGAKQNLPFNQTTDRAGKDVPSSSSSSSAGDSSSFAAAAAARSPFDNVSPPKATKSPFASSSSSSSSSTPSSPFAKASATSNASPSPMAPMKPATKVKNPFNEPDAATYGVKPMKVDKPKEVKFEIPKVTFGQIFIVLSFTTIIGLMIGTFWVVWNSGGIRFNET